MKHRNRILLCAASAVTMLVSANVALAGPRDDHGPRDPHQDRRAPPPRPYYHNYNNGYYAAPVYAPPPVVYAPQPSVGINLVLPFHF